MRHHVDDEADKASSTQDSATDTGNVELCTLKGWWVIQHRYASKPSEHCLLWKMAEKLPQKKQQSFLGLI